MLWAGVDVGTVPVLEWCLVHGVPEPIKDLVDDMKGAF